MKAYTDLEQSKKLIEILPLESADMFYRDNGIDVKLMWEHTAQKVTNPCWSLSALIKMLPKGFLLMDNQGESESGLYSVWVSGFSNPHIWRNNPVDAAFEMICWLKEAGSEWDANKKELKKIEKKSEEKSIIPSLKDFQEAFELKARQYDIELPNRGYDIHAMCKELYSLLIGQKPTWKPSDEQMKALKEASDEHWELDGLEPLYTLYQDLKKLKL